MKATLQTSLKLALFGLLLVAGTAAKAGAQTAKLGDGPTGLPGREGD